MAADLRIGCTIWARLLIPTGHRLARRGAALPLVLHQAHGVEHYRRDESDAFMMMDDDGGDGERTNGVMITMRAMTMMTMTTILTTLTMTKTMMMMTGPRSKDSEGRPADHDKVVRYRSSGRAAFGTMAPMLRSRCAPGAVDGGAHAARRAMEHERWKTDGRGSRARRTDCDSVRGSGVGCDRLGPTAPVQGGEGGSTWQHTSATCVNLESSSVRAWTRVRCQRGSERRENANATDAPRRASRQPSPSVGLPGPEGGGWIIAGWHGERMFCAAPRKVDACAAQSSTRAQLQ